MADARLTTGERRSALINLCFKNAWPSRGECKLGRVGAARGAVIDRGRRLKTLMTRALK